VPAFFLFAEVLAIKNGLDVRWIVMRLNRGGAEALAVAVRYSTCGWRIVISHKIPQDSPPCCHASMRHLVVLFIISLLP
jgi:hypothetical protein